MTTLSSAPADSAPDGAAGYDIAVIPGDGIGPEVIVEALKVLRAAARPYGLDLRTAEVPVGAEFYLEYGEVLPGSVIDQLGGADAILLGAVGDPRVPPGVLERGLILELRRRFDQYVNYRPARMYPGVESVVRTATPSTCDLVVLRENTEGLYAGAGTYLRHADGSGVATQTSVTTRFATERIVRFGFELAHTRRRRLTMVHKTNILVDAGQLWLDVVAEVAPEYPDIDTDYQHVDAMCQHLLVDPGRFDVIVTENLFGDILSDLTATLHGGLAVAASANLNPERRAPSMFEPVHGSAPDIAGKGRANPVAAVLSAALMLRHLGEERAADLVERAVAAVLSSPGLAGAATSVLGDAIVERVESLAS